MVYPPLHLLLNPAAGRGRAGRRRERIVRYLRAAGLDPVVHDSTAPGHLEDTARELAANDVTLVVAGGDGSVHELVNGLLKAGTAVPFGVIPIGTGNDFAKAAEIPLDWETATRLLAERIVSSTPARPVDAGRMNARYFANGAGIGFDGTVNRIARSYRRPMGDTVYLLAVLRALADGVATPHMRIVDDDTVWDSPLTLANIANGPWVGGMFHIAPAADPADGELDLTIAGPVTRRRILQLLPKLVKGTHVAEPEVRNRRVRRLAITAAAPVASHLDGEVQPLGTHFEIEVLPGALRLI